jgi:15-O-acetyltransferase Tri3
MSWQQTSVNHYQRPLGENERLIKFIGDRAHPAGREQWSVSATAIFKPSDSRLATEWAATTLRDAWKLLRFQHPSIASTPSVGSDSLEYAVPSENDLESWADATFIVAGEDTCAEDVIARIKPSSLMTLYFIPHRWEILLHTSHWRTDGYGAFQLINAFFNAVKEVVDNNGLPVLSWGEEIPRLVPSVESALNLPEAATPETIVIARKYASTQRYMKDSVGIPYNGNMTTRPGGTRTARMQLSKETTEALQHASNERQIDLFSAVHAALAIVNLENANTASTATPNDEKQYASTIRLSLRPHLASPHTNNPSVAAGVYTGGYIFKVTGKDDFNEIAKQYQHEYNHGVTSEFLQSRRQFAAMAVEGLQKGLPLPSPPPSNVDISFVTDTDDMVTSVFDTRAGPLEVLRVGLGVETLTRQPLLFFWNFRGQLDLSVVYNESYQDDGTAYKILKDVVQALENGLLK